MKTKHSNGISIANTSVSDDELSLYSLIDENAKLKKEIVSLKHELDKTKSELDNVKVLSESLDDE